MRLENKVALITGGNSGIGRATALLFAEEGARIGIAARDEARGQETVEAIERLGGEAVFTPCDVTRAADCEEAVKQTVDQFGKLDILFNNAAIIYPHKTLLETTEEEWMHTMDVNVKGIYLMSKYAIPHMMEANAGAIVNTGSIYGLVGGPGNAAYCASKGAVVLLTKAMALDYADVGIRVNCVCPGSVDTPMLRSEMEDLGGYDEAAPLFAAKHALNRICSPEEVAHAVLYLVSEEASFVTGISLPVDGGRSAR